MNKNKMWARIVEIMVVVLVVVLVIVAVVALVLNALNTSWTPGEKGGADKDGPKNEPAATQTISYLVKGSIPGEKNGWPEFRAIPVN